ncbi:MAG: hypothetical protein H0X64_04260 [Gemmatimonadaceae bacterium]|nr:hypothetical protein [Gemmatimonadaceae bacterium]
MRFVIATQHSSGLRFALRLLDEGHEVVAAYAEIDDRRLAPRHALLGQGLLDRRPIDDVVRDREQFRDAYWVWDENHSVDANEPKFACMCIESKKKLTGDLMDHPMPGKSF